MSLFDDFIAENASEDLMWQIIEDYDLFESQGHIGSCLLRTYASEIQKIQPQLNLMMTTHVMKELYIASLRRLAFKNRLGDNK
jgi:bifunctional N-acetylglucosamine-1-phosphate-uridyltransferase/glucosamine-1-phosphate-acetyltransferase GlmU-like protein